MKKRVNALLQPVCLLIVAIGICGWLCGWWLIRLRFHKFNLLCRFIHRRKHQQEEIIRRLKAVNLQADNLLEKMRADNLKWKEQSAAADARQRKLLAELKGGHHHG